MAVPAGTYLSYDAVGIVEQTADTVTQTNATSSEKGQAKVAKHLKTSNKDFKFGFDGKAPSQRLLKARALARSRGAI